MSASRVLKVLCVAVLASCTSRQAPVQVMNVVANTNPQADLAAAVLREYGMQPDINIKRGQDVVMGTAPCEMGSACFSCFQCHGIRGEGGATAALPRLAGQDRNYLHRSLQEFASGQRPSATMHEVASALTEQQKKDVALYYSVVAAPAPLIAAAEGDDARAQAGGAIDEHGLPNAGVPACMTCHSAARPAGTSYPYLAGQFADYLEQQLAHFRAGTRGGADAQVMQAIARGLNDEQARAVSVHFASQAPPQNAAPKPTG